MAGLAFELAVNGDDAGLRPLVRGGGLVAVLQIGMGLAGHVGLTFCELRDGVVCGGVCAGLLAGFVAACVFGLGPADEHAVEPPQGNADADQLDDAGDGHAIGQLTQAFELGQPGGDGLQPAHAQTP